MMINSDHAGDKLTRHSWTGFLTSWNMALIDWVSKKQHTIKSSVFGAKFVAMKHGMEKLRGLRYKIRMMGTLLTGSSYIHGDNMSVITKNQRLKSTLKKEWLLHLNMQWENPQQWGNPWPGISCYSMRKVWRQMNKITRPLTDRACMEVQAEVNGVSHSYMMHEATQMWLKEILWGE